MWVAARILLLCCYVAILIGESSAYYSVFVQLMVRPTTITLEWTSGQLATTITLE